MSIRSVVTKFFVGVISVGTTITIAACYGAQTPPPHNPSGAGNPDTSQPSESVSSSSNQEHTDNSSEIQHPPR